MKVLFMGTPDFSVPTLKELIEKGHEVVGVITQPDKPKGRGKMVVCTPVKECALEHDIKVYQPVKVREKSFVDIMKDIDFDVIVVVAFGQILSKEILDLPKYGCINVHSSLLPSYRGAAPIQWTILNGETRTGVTTMYMDDGIDTGDILLQEVTDIRDDDTGGTLHDRLAVMGADLLIKTLDGIEKGTITRTKQDNEKASYVGMLSKSQGEIDFSNSAVTIERLVRGLNPWPSAYTSINGKILKIWKAKVLKEDTIKDRDIHQMKNGEVVKITKESIIVKTGKDYLECIEVQLAGKKKMAVQDFLRGYNMEEGAILGK